jgi:DNA-binding MarR family transcriptional regulator
LRKIDGIVCHNASTMPEHDLSQYLAWLLASAHRQMKMGIAQSIADEEVNEEHWRILQVVSDEQGHSMGPALTKNVDKLVSRGLVQRAQDAHDSRKVLVYISDRGLEMVARLKRSVDAHHGAIEDALGPRNSKQLKRLLERLIEQSRSH